MNRFTLTLPDKVKRKIKDRAEKERKSLSLVITEACMEWTR